MLPREIEMVFDRIGLSSSEVWILCYIKHIIKFSSIVSASPPILDLSTSATSVVYVT